MASVAALRNPNSKRLLSISSTFFYSCRGGGGGGGTIQSQRRSHFSISETLSAANDPVSDVGRLWRSMATFTPTKPHHVNVGHVDHGKTTLTAAITRVGGTGLLAKWGAVMPAFTTRSITTAGHAEKPTPPVTDVAPPRIKFKRLDKTAKHIMQILDKEAVQEVKEHREFPDIRPGYIVQLKVEVPENKRRTSTVKGIVIARRNAGLNSTFRIRRLVAGVGVESVFPLYSPNIKEMKVVDKKKVRRAKLYYLRDRMNALKNQ